MYVYQLTKQTFKSVSVKFSGLYPLFFAEFQSWGALCLPKCQMLNKYKKIKIKNIENENPSTDN